jgi:hypothetical protein
MMPGMRRSVPHIIEYKRSKTARFCVDIREDGKRTRKFFTTKSAAQKALKDITTKIRREGETALSVSDATRIAAVEAEKTLARFPGATIAKAVEFYVAHLEAAQRSIPIRQLITEHLEAKAQDKELSKVHMYDLRTRYARFNETFGDVGTRVITTQAGRRVALETSLVAPEQKELYR